LGEAGNINIQGENQQKLDHILKVNYSF